MLLSLHVFPLGMHTLLQARLGSLGLSSLDHVWAQENLLLSHLSSRTGGGQHPRQGSQQPAREQRQRHFILSLTLSKAAGREDCPLLDWGPWPNSLFSEPHAPGQTEGPPWPLLRTTLCRHPPSLPPAQVRSPRYRNHGMACSRWAPCSGAWPAPQGGLRKDLIPTAPLQL